MGAPNWINVNHLRWQTLCDELYFNFKTNFPCWEMRKRLLD